MKRDRIVHPGTGQVLTWGSEEECLAFLNDEAKRLRGSVVLTHDNGNERWYEIRGHSYIYQKQQEFEKGVISNNLFNVGWLGFLAIALLPIVAPAVNMSTMVLDKDGDRYYEKNGIDKKSAMFVIYPCLVDTLKEVKPTLENVDKFYEVSCKKLVEAYGATGLTVDFDKYDPIGDAKSTYKEFFEAYYKLIVETCGDRLLEEHEKAQQS